MDSELLEMTATKSWELFAIDMVHGINAYRSAFKMTRIKINRVAMTTCERLAQKYFENDTLDFVTEGDIGNIIIVGKAVHKIETADDLFLMAELHDAFRNAMWQQNATGVGIGIYGSMLEKCFVISISAPVQ